MGYCPESPHLHGCWESLVVGDGERLYGIFDGDGTAPEPLAMFRTQLEAECWIEAAKRMGDERRLIWMEVAQLQGLVWNSDDPAPPLDCEPWLQEVFHWEAEAGWREEKTLA